MLRILALLASILCAAMAPPVWAEDRPVTVLISIDGFRPDYLDRGITPRLSKLKAEGVFAPMRPSFPTVTFPNHLTLVTGLRPDHHGIVGNAMIDPARPGQMFSISDPKQSLDPFWWSGAEPIWITAEKQGIRTATAFWPGSEVLNHDARPQDWLRFDQNISNVQRVNTVIDWLRRPEAIRPRLITLYFDTVDHMGHSFGVSSPEVNKAIAEVDGRIGDLVDGLAGLGLTANIVIVSDHGMADRNAARTIQLDTLIDRASYIAVETGPYAAIEPAAGTDNRVADALLRPHDHMTCQRKEDLPKRLHYGQNARVAAIICLAEPGWTILSGVPQYEVKGGNHGWDNAMPEMNALFLATGPAMAQGKVLPVFDNVDVYDLLAKLAGIAPLANDGSDHLITEAMRTQQAR